MCWTVVASEISHTQPFNLHAGVYSNLFVTSLVRNWIPEKRTQLFRHVITIPTIASVFCYLVVVVIESVSRTAGPESATMSRKCLTFPDTSSKYRGYGIRIQSEYLQHLSWVLGDVQSHHFVGICLRFPFDGRGYTTEGSGGRFFPAKYLWWMRWASGQVGVTRTSVSDVGVGMGRVVDWASCRRRWSHLLESLYCVSYL